MGKPEKALEDAEKTIQLNSNYSKGYQRKAQALNKLDRFEEAIESANKGLSLDSNNQFLKDAYIFN